VFGISLENEIRSKCKFIDKNEDLLIFIDSLINVPRSESKLVDLDEISKDLVEIFNGNFNKVSNFFGYIYESIIFYSQYASI
jgi:hypothetical protein